MTTRTNGEAIRWLDALHREGSAAGTGDGRLLELFRAGPGAAGEAAFEAIVRRHGPAVLAVCRVILRSDHDADDAFQATFLVLARRAASVRDPDRLAQWLGRVARRIALRSRRDAARRAAVERPCLVGEPEAAPAESNIAGLDAAALVVAEVDRLPEADRLLLRWTYWQGETYAEVAARLAWPIGTVRSRLARVRDRLRGRLARLGLAPALATAWADSEASAATPSEALILRTVQAATRSAGEISAAVAAGTVPASVAALVNGELAAMSILSWKSAAALLLLGGTATVGAVSLVPRDPVGVPAPPAVAPAAGATAQGKAILTNGGVEDGAGDAPKSWSRGAAIPGVAYLWSRDAAHEGKASLGLKKTADRYFPIAQWSQTVAREGDRPRLKVSAWIKADRAAKAILDVQFLDASDAWQHAWVAYIGAKEPDGPPVTHDWKRHEGVVAIPPGTKKVVIAPQIYGPGTVWFDDLAAEFTDDPATDPLAP